MADRDQPALARRIQQLAESGEYEGFNALIGAIVKEKAFDDTEIDVIKRDGEFKQKITDICRDAWDRKHPWRR